MILARPCKILDGAVLEHWAEKYASQLLAAWECSDVCEYMDLWDWLDLCATDTFTEFEEWFREQHLTRKMEVTK